MKVLITSVSRNPYITELIESLADLVSVKNSVTDFWDTEELFDVIHIQWPEELFKWKAPGKEQLDRFNDRIVYWKSKGAKIVVTRHNVLPNKADADLYIPLYESVYQSADAVIHLGKFSLDDFVNQKSKKHLLNWLVPHHIYQSYPNEVTRQQARKQMNIAQHKKVILFFGQIRNEQEKQLILSVFSKLNVKDKYLLVPGFYEQFTNRRDLGKQVIQKIKHLYNKLFKKSWLGYRFIAAEDVQYFFKSSDIVVIPRVNNLTSGVVYLALAFNNKIIGPKSGNITEVLQWFNFPTFEPGNDSALISEIEGALADDVVIKVEDNKREMFFLDFSARKHVELYTKLIENKDK